MRYKNKKCVFTEQLTGLEQQDVVVNYVQLGK